jgi:hypothetical protein
MNFFAIRLKRHPHLFVGKESPSYAIRSDQVIQERLRVGNRGHETVDSILGVDAYWFKPEKLAKLWTDAVPIKRLFSYKTPTDDNGKKITPTFNEYEVIHNGSVISYEELKNL